MERSEKSWMQSSRSLVLSCTKYVFKRKGISRQKAVVCISQNNPISVSRMPVQAGLRLSLQSLVCMNWRCHK
jgi:hypothetical protein